MKEYNYVGIKMENAQKQDWYGTIATKFKYNIKSERKVSLNTFGFFFVALMLISS